MGGTGQNTATVTAEERGLTTGVESPTTGEAGGTDTVVTTVWADEVVETDTGLPTHNGAPRRRTRQAEPQTGTGITSRPQTRAAKRLADDEERRRRSQVTAPSSEEHGPAGITAATSGDGDEKHLTAIPTPAMPEEADVVRRATPGKEGDRIVGREHQQSKSVVERYDEAGRNDGDRVRQKPPAPDVSAPKAKVRRRPTKAGKDKRPAGNVLPRVGGGKGQRGGYGDVEPGQQVRRDDGKRDITPHAEEDESLEERRPSEPTLQLTDEEIVEAQQRSRLVTR
ncbi:hypothetical protein PR001_g29783 [Phytophthora rubi]|uniref:Uncharacterized protein n=2 Tax=Phytophthora rubi TaxID=129364 RepID=A0A6A3GZD3_9STRA|nr:hypothetical protein PR001_g29783 [Phytophthora rubi]